MNAQTKIEAATVPAVYSAISAVMEHMSKEGIGKDRKNTTQGYKFRGIDDVYNALSSVLAENKLIMLPFVQDMQREERQTRGGGALNYTILTVDFKLVSAEDGSTDTVRMIGEAMDSADKSSNKAQSAALKYAALQVFMIPTEGDNDADTSTHEVAARGGSERANPEAQQKSPDGPANQMPDAEYDKIVQLLKATNSDAGPMLKHYRVKNIRQLDQTQFADAVKHLTDRLAVMAKDETNKSAGFGEVLADEIPY